MQTIPIPKRGEALRTHHMWFMAVGESEFAVPKGDQSVQQLARNLSSFGRVVRQKTGEGRQFSVRTVTEPHPRTGKPVKGVRFWRVA